MENLKSFLGVVGIFLGAVLVFWLVTPFVVRHLYPDMSNRGLFGDLYGSINALFSGLAFVGIIAAILLQRQELQLQREELAATRRELSRTANAQEKQFADTKIFQRAYLSANPDGVHLLNTGDQLLGHVEVENVGHLPARDVKWYVRMHLSLNEEEKFDFESHPLQGSNVVPPGAKMIQGSAGIRLGEALEKEKNFGGCFLYVWGQIRYDDGLGDARFTNFCHRYNFSARARPGYEVSVQVARYHQFGNDAD